MTAHSFGGRTTAAIACMSVLVAAGCRRSAAPEAAASAATSAVTPDAPVHPASAARPPRLRLDEAQLGQIKIEELSTRSGGGVIRATGTVEFNADRIARILAPVAGQVQELKLNVGDDVRRGDTIFVLSSREVASAIADHLASQKDLDLSEKAYAMTKDLFEHQAASRMAMQQSENDVAKARAKVAQTAEVLRVLGFDEQAVDSGVLASHVPIRAPITGIVTERTVTNGQFVGVESTPLLTIADLSSVWVQADVFERDLHSIAAGEKADVTTAAYPDDHFSAQVSRIGTVVDPQTRTAKIRFVTSNPGLRLKPGMFTTATLQIPGSSNTALTAPAKAVFVEGGKSFAYVQIGRAEFERREVETVPADIGRVRVTRGLSAGDHVVAEGVLLLRARETDGASE
ncbi:MAG TPA: efflux RND transporter periplasmic adaptor subunit [Vicinamibacterales bacterium]|nr:efflux RND transporter periplasmic adaptor subunit [Vicinamibacterales bacterium]